MRTVSEEDRGAAWFGRETARSEEHTSELQSRQYLVCRLLLEKKKKYEIDADDSDPRTQSSVVSPQPMPSHVGAVLPHPAGDILSSAGITRTSGTAVNIADVYT